MCMSTCLTFFSQESTLSIPCVGSGRSWKTKLYGKPACTEKSHQEFLDVCNDRTFCKWGSLGQNQCMRHHTSYDWCFPLSPILTGVCFIALKLLVSNYCTEPLNLKRKSFERLVHVGMCVWEERLHSPP